MIDRLTLWLRTDNDGELVSDFELGDAFFDGKTASSTNPRTVEEAQAAAIEYAKNNGYDVDGEWEYRPLTHSWTMKIKWAKVSKEITIGERSHVSSYEIRGTKTQEGDWITSWTRRINGRKYDFGIVEWVDGPHRATISVYHYGTTTLVHEFNIPR